MTCDRNKGSLIFFRDFIEGDAKAEWIMKFFVFKIEMWSTKCSVSPPQDNFRQNFFIPARNLMNFQHITLRKPFHSTQKWSFPWVEVKTNDLAGVELSKTNYFFLFCLKFCWQLESIFMLRRRKITRSFLPSVLPDAVCHWTRA